MNDMTHTSLVFAADTETFDKMVMASDIPVVVDFWAPWCAPCRQVLTFLDEVANEFAGKVKIVKVNADANPDLANQFRVMSLPHFLFMNQGMVYAAHSGTLSKQKMVEWISEQWNNIAG